MNISVKFVLIVDNTVYLLKHFNKKRIELELEIQSLKFFNMRPLKTLGTKGKLKKMNI